MSAKPQGKKKLINTSPNNSFVRSCHNYILPAIALLKDLKTFPGLHEPQIGHWIMEDFFFFFFFLRNCLSSLLQQLLHNLLVLISF